MRTPALFFLLLGGACQQSPATPTSSAPAQLKPPAAQVAERPSSAVWTAAQKGCIENYLEAHALDGFGSPRGSMYPGGTPLFDEATGQRLSREEYLAKNHPDILRACGL
jgi:hypothetical protein